MLVVEIRYAHWVKICSEMYFISLQFSIKQVADISVAKSPFLGNYLLITSSIHNVFTHS